MSTFLSGQEAKHEYLYVTLQSHAFKVTVISRAHNTNRFGSTSSESMDWLADSTRACCGKEIEKAAGVEKESGDISP